MLLRIVRIGEALHERVPSLSVLSVIEPKLSDYGFVKPFDLAVGLGMVGRRRKMFNSKECTHCSKVLTNKLCTIAREDVSWYAVRHDPEINEYIRNMRWRCRRRRYGLCYPRRPVRDYHDELMTV